MSVTAKAQLLTQSDSAPSSPRRLGVANGVVALDFARLLGIALGIGLAAGLGMMLAVLLIA